MYKGIFYGRFTESGGFTVVIGIVSLYYQNYNYGGQLQAFAMQQALKEHGFKSEHIRFKRDISGLAARKTRIAETTGIKKISAVANVAKGYAGFAVRRAISLPVRSGLKSRDNAFADFENRLSHSSGIYDEQTIISCAKNYDAFICGSDVIWNAGVSPYISALGFVPDEKRKIAYAPSLGEGTIPDGWFSSYRRYLERLDYISVREPTVAKELRVLLPDKHICDVCDPTLLLASDVWSELVKQPKESGYILCYLLGDSLQQRHLASQLAKEMNLKLLTFPYITNNRFRSCDQGFGDIRNFTANSLDFLSLIRGASLIVSDSFHAIVFSTLFHKRFIALDRINGDNSGMSGRVRNYLASLGAVDCLAPMGTSSWSAYINELDYCQVDDRVMSIRTQSQNYLSEALRGLE